jgi:hypothetical protein
MDHDGAIQGQAVERYMLGTMSTQERDDFEDHFFGCTECAEEVRIAVRFRANAREVLREESIKPKAATSLKDRWGWFRFPIFGPIMAVCALLLAYQNSFQIPSLKSQIQTRALLSFALHPATRAEAQPDTHIPPDVPEFSMYFDVPAGPAAYECTVLDPAGKEAARFSAVPPKRGEALTVVLNRRNLAPGTYTLKVHPEGAPDTDSRDILFKFTLE